MKFNIGDRVRTIETPLATHNFVNREATIIGITPNNIYPIHLKFDNGDSCDWKDDGDLLKIINKQTPMIRINNMMKKLLDKDTQLLVQAGLINGDLKLTDAGITELATINFETNKAKLVETAKEIIAEEKENKE